MADASGRDEALWADLARWVEATLGLHFPERLRPDLQRGMEAAARRLHLDGATACARHALSHELDEHARQAIAECLAIGETYFFRDPEWFEQLARHVLAPLLAERRRGSRHLRLWSAGCSSGEEAYSLAMLVASVLPDWREWNFSVLGTDVNAAALRNARTGAYGAWSLRGGVPERCAPFLHAGADGRHHVDAELRRRVHFRELNLAGCGYPSAATLTTGMDLVLCRNVLIYFEPARARSVLARLGQSLADGGWLVPGCVELPSEPLPGLRAVRIDGLFALRRPPSVQPLRPQPAAPVAMTRAPAAAPAAPALLQQARERADAGDLARAEALCREAIAQDSLDPQATFLLASILTERGELVDAMAALHRTLSLDPGDLLARFNLGSLALRLGRAQAGRHHFAQALARLAQVPPGAVVPGSGGLTARELQDAIRRAEAAAP